MKLTSKKIGNTKSKEKAYKLSDGGGLFLYVAPTGTKSWRLKYRFGGKEKSLTFGQFPHITLAEAREKRDWAKKLLAHNKDPGFEKKQISVNLQRQNQFKTIALEWMDAKKVTWSPSYFHRTKALFEQNIFPYLGLEDIANIKPLHMLTVLRMIEQRSAFALANKARTQCAEIFNFAVITERAEHNPAANLSSALSRRLSQNFPFLTESEMRIFLSKLHASDLSQIAKMATLTLIYTAIRTVEMRYIRWQDVDFTHRCITIPAERMKKKRVHIVPMTTQLNFLFQKLHKITCHHLYVFSFPGKIQPISDKTVLNVIKRLGYAGKASGHGFRHQFSTVLHEAGFNHDWIEKQLNHESGGIRAIYNHAEYWEHRQHMMQWYANYIDGLIV